MALKAVLFDLDEALLPLNLNVFTKAYFKRLATKLEPYGYEPKALADAIEQRIKARKSYK